MRGSFDRFTERARKVLTLAQEAAQRFNHNYIGTEHLLLGLVREDEGVAIKVLENLGIDPDQVRENTLRIIGQGERQAVGEIGLTPRSKKVIELAVDEARRMGHHYIGTEHLLLGLIREEEGIAAGVLRHLGLTLENARAEVERVLSTLSVPEPRPEMFPSPEREITPEYLAEVFADRGRGISGSLNRFTERARRVLVLAQEEAHRFNHNYIGTEHLLLGLAREREGVAAKVLAHLGVELTLVRSSVEFTIGRGERQVVGEIGMTPRAKKVIELAVDEARRLNHNYIGTEHLLLGLIREGEGIAAGVLESLGVNLQKVRDEVLTVIGDASVSPLEHLQAEAARLRAEIEDSKERLASLEHLIERLQQED